MNHRRASTGGAVASSTYPSSPEKVDMGYQEEGDSDDNGQVTTTIITYTTTNNRTTRRASFSGPITRRRNSNHHAEIWISDDENAPPAKPVLPCPSKNTSHKGINPDVVARMSVTKNAANVIEDDDDDVLSPEQPRRGYVGQSNSGIDIYGLHRAIAHQQSTGAAVRRGSNASSVHSRSSRASQRRRSSLDRRKFVSKDPLQAVKIYSTPKSAKSSEGDSDDVLESDDDDAPAVDVQAHFGYESDANESESEHSMAESMSSSKRSRSRRNSCIIRHPEHNSVLGGAGRVMMTTKMAQEEEEEDDPDSLLQRAIRRSQSMDNTIHTNVPSVLGDLEKPELTGEVYHDAVGFMPKNPEVYHDAVSVLPKSDRLETVPPVVSNATTIGGGGGVVPSAGSSDGGWRKEPLTIAYASPTEENLKANLKHMLRIDKFSGNNIMALSPIKSPRKHASPQPDAGWGDLTMQALNTPGASEEESSDNSSYGASMYVESQKYSPDDFDIYHQKARRRASIESTFVDIDTTIQHPPTGGSAKLPQFVPAEGCRNASDFVVRCFTARMRVTGFTVLKHNRSRWSKAKHRVIYLLPDHQTLSWRPTPEDGNVEEAQGGNMKADGGPKIDLSKCLEVRHSSSVDPKAPKKRGTAVLRSRCREDLMATKSFSLIFANRTLDLTAFSNDQCKVLMEGFSALCFRLQLQKIQQAGGGGTKPEAPPPEDYCSTVDDNDWASTKFGGSTTNTTSSTPVGPTPWGY